MGKLCLVSWVSIVFIACQLTGGLLAGSIAIMCDTAHLATDMIGFIVGIVALKLSMASANSDLTFGWQRAEVIGALFSVIFLICITVWLVFEAIGRVLEPGEIDSDIMMFIAVIGLIFNLIQMQILHDDHSHGGGEEGGHDHGHGHSHEGGVIDGDDVQYHGGHSHDDDEGNLNVDQAFLHALSDMLNSIGVCIAALIIWFFP